MLKFIFIVCGSFLLSWIAFCFCPALSHQIFSIGQIGFSWMFLMVVGLILLAYRSF